MAAEGQAREAAAYLRELADIVPAERIALINPLVHTNVDALEDAAYRRYLFWINAARDVEHPPVRLGRYAPDTYIDGDGPFHIVTEGGVVAEHLVPDFRDSAAHLHRVQATRHAAVTVAAPCVYACHPGVNVWSHWLIDTLPRILLAEQAFPGKFVFAVPATITDSASPLFLARSVCESLIAYGIAPHRLLRLRAGILYRFDALFDLLGLTADGMHPAMLRALRQIAPPPSRRRATPRILAALREPGHIRPLLNRAEILEPLRLQCALFQNPGATSFAEKLHAFATADVIVGDLGSNLAMSIYARPRAGIVTLAPGLWRDNYFAQFFQRIDIYHADLRGPPSPEPGEPPGHHAYRLDPAHLHAGLEAVRAARSTPLGPGPVLVCGRRIARAPGPVRLRIDFGMRGNAERFRRGEFSSSEGTHTWALGPNSGLVIPDFGRDIRSDFWIEIKGIGFIAPPRLPSRPLKVSANGCELDSFDTDALTHLHVFLPRAVASRAADLIIDFAHPVCPSPHALGVSNDRRPLGFMFEFVALREAAGRPRASAKV